MLLVMYKAMCKVILLWHQLMIVKIVNSLSRVSFIYIVNSNYHSVFILFHFILNNFNNHQSVLENH